jgi:hypothetical protein
MLAVDTEEASRPTESTHRPLSADEILRIGKILPIELRVSPCKV